MTNQPFPAPDDAPATKLGGVFIGIERVRTVRQLAEAWQAAVTERRMELVVLEGSSGAGKTAVVQALYEQLAMRQPRPAYWPSTLSSPRADSIFPEQVSPAVGAVPSFFWWGLTPRPGGSALLEADPQIRAHVEPIAAAVARGDRLLVDRLQLAARAAFLLGNLGLLGAAVGALVQDIDNVLDVGELRKSGAELWRSRESLLEQALRRNSGTVFSVGARAEALERARQDGRALAMVASVLPILIAVEDAQHLDPVTIALLRVLLHESDACGLMVLTVATDQRSTGIAPAADTATIRTASGSPLEEWLDVEGRAGPMTTIHLAPLTSQEMTELAVQYLGSSIDPAGLFRVIDHAGGVPGVLLDLLQAPAVLDGLRGDGTVPADLRAVSPLAGPRVAFASMPAGVRRVLVVAGLHGRYTFRSWLHPLDTDHETTGTVLASDDVTAALTTGWLVQQQDSQILQFADPHLLNIAVLERDRNLTAQTQAALHHDLTARIRTARTDGTWIGLDVSVRESLLAAVVDQDQTGLGSPESVPPEFIAELMTIRRVTGRAAASAAQLEQITNRLAAGTSPSTVLAVATAEALFDAGELDRTFTLLRSNLDRLTAQYGTDHPATLPALHSLAAVYGAAAQSNHGHPQAAPVYELAISLYQRLLAARQRATPTHGAHRATHLQKMITTRRQYVLLLAGAYRYNDVIEQVRLLMAEQQQLTGPDHPDTLTTRNNLAIWRGDSGDLGAATTAFEDLLTDRVRVLGPDHPDTLNTRNNLATWRGRAGDLGAAITISEALLRDQARVLGPDHPDTLNTRSNLANMRGRSGKLDAAIAALEELLPDRARVLGPDHPNTLATRNNLADWRGESGDLDAAVTAFEDLLPDWVRVLGPDHPNTLATRSSLAAWRGEAGDLDAAIVAFEELLPDQVRVLGPNHPDTLATRGSLASLRGRSGDLLGAITAVEDLLPDRVRVLGPDHPDTLATRSNLANMWGASGHLDAAISALEDLLADRVRVLGPDHPDTFATRKHLANLQNKRASGEG